MQTWDGSQALDVVRAVVNPFFNKGMFRHFPDLHEDDVVQQLLAWAATEYDRFDPARASFVTWLTMFASRRIHNVHRDRSRVAKREGRYARERDEGREYANDRTSDDARRVPVYYAEDVQDPVDEPETFEGEIVGTHKGAQPTPAEFLHTVYVYARRTYTAPAHRRGRWRFTAAQAAACAALQNRLNLSVRGIRDLFEERADLRTAVGFLDGVPGHDWFWRAADVQTLSRKKV